MCALTSFETLLFSSFTKMKHDDFQKLMKLQLDRRRFSFWQRVMHTYEKHKWIRAGISISLGAVCKRYLVLTCSLNLYPGVHLQVQRPIKLKCASSYLQYTYLSNEYTEGILFEREADWEKAISVNDYYANKMRRDNIYEPGFVEQSVDLLNQIVIRYEQTNSMLGYTLESLGDLIEPVVNHDMKMFKHPELNSALDNIFRNVIKCTEDVEKKVEKFGIEDRDKVGWSVVVSVFLILVEVNQDREYVAKRVEEMNRMVNHLDFTSEMCAQPQVLARLEKFANSDNKELREASRRLIKSLARIKESEQIVLESGVTQRLQ
jgi:hypothetical protein